MKKSRMLLVAMLVCIVFALIAVPAMAAPAIAPDSLRFADDSGVMDNFTLDMLATTGGMAVVAAALVQATKYFVNVNPKWLALCWALALNAIYVFALATERTASLYITAALNVPFVAVAASGAYEYGIKALQNKLAQGKEAKAQGDATTDEGGDGNE